VSAEKGIFGNLGMRRIDGIGVCSSCFLSKRQTEQIKEMGNTNGRSTCAPCGERSDWKDKGLCPVDFTERPATHYSDAYCDFEVNGDVQNGV
jgi:hypothetical protein